MSHVCSSTTFFYIIWILILAIYITNAQTPYNDVLLTPTNLNENGASVTPISQVSTKGSLWEVDITSQAQWQFKIDLEGDSWGFDPLDISTIFLFVDGNGTAPPLDNIFFTFAFNNYYFTSRIVMSNDDANRIYPGCDDSPIPTTNLSFNANILNLPQTNRSNDVMGDVSPEIKMKPVSYNTQTEEIIGINTSPMTFVLENDPDLNILTVNYFTDSDVFEQTCGFKIFHTGYQGLTIFIGGDDPGESFDIFSFGFEYWAENPPPGTNAPTTNNATFLTNGPTTNPTIMTQVTVNPSMNPTVNPTMNPTRNPITMNPTVNPTVNPTGNPITMDPTSTPTTPITPVTSTSTTQSFVPLDCNYMNNGFITLSFDYELLMNTSNAVITNNLLNLTRILISELTQCPISNYDTNIILNKPNHANIYISLCTDCNDSSIQQNLMTEFIIQNILSVVQNSTKIDVEVIKTGQGPITTTITSSIQNDESSETIKNENNTFWIFVYIVIALIVTCIICLCIIMIWKYKKTKETHSTMVDNMSNDVNMTDINSNSDNIMFDEYTNDISDGHDKDVAPGSVVNVNDEIIIESETEDDDKKTTKGGDDMSATTSKENSNDLLMIKEWLEYKVCLIKYFDNFVDNGYGSMDFIKAISDRQQLEEIGIIIPGHKTKILAEIKKLANNMSGVLEENKQQHEGRDETVINDIYPTPMSTN